MQGFSPDGFITDQDCFRGFRYHGTTSDINGCGWIAAYNLRRAAGQDLDCAEVCREMDAMYRLPLPGPTSVRKLRQYLSRHLRYGFAAGKRRALTAARESDAGILRYWEGREPHFIAFLRREDGLYRFFNVADGQEDITLPMDEFFRKHCTRGYIRVIVWKRQPA